MCHTGMLTVFPLYICTVLLSSELGWQLAELVIFWQLQTCVKPWYKNTHNEKIACSADLGDYSMCILLHCNYWICSF